MKQPRAANALRGRRTVRNPRCREIVGLSRVLLAPRIRASGSCSSRQPASPGCFRPGRHLCGGGTNLLCRGLQHLLLSIGKQNTQRRFNHEETSKQSQSTSNAGPGQPRRRLSGYSQDGMNAGLQMFRRCREIYAPVSRILGGIQSGKVNQALRILGSPFGRISDNCEIARQLTIELHSSNRIPRRRMKENKGTACDSKPVPDKIPATNVMQFMTQNVFKFGAILFQANIGQHNGRPDPAKRCRRSGPGQYQQFRAAHVKVVRQGPKGFRDLSGWLTGETQNPFELPMLLDLRSQHVDQDQHVSNPHQAHRDTQRECPRAGNLQGPDGGTCCLNLGGGRSSSWMPIRQNTICQPEPIGCRRTKESQPDHKSPAWRIDQPAQGETHPEGKRGFQREARKRGRNT